MLLDTLQITGTNAGSPTVLELRCCVQGPRQKSFCPVVPVRARAVWVAASASKNTFPHHLVKMIHSRCIRILASVLEIHTNKKNTKNKPPPTVWHYVWIKLDRDTVPTHQTWHGESTANWSELFGNDSLICPLWHLLSSEFPCCFLYNVGGICIIKKKKDPRVQRRKTRF